MAAKVSNVRINIGAKADVSGAINGVLGSFKSFAGRLMSMLSPVRLAIAGVLGGVGIGALGGQLLSLASDAQEMGSKFQAVFKEQAALAEQWASEFAESVGRSRYELMGYMATLQDTFVPAGFARDEARKLSEQVTQLAVDLASFNNMGDSEALERLQGALIGNHENALRFGVIINEAALKEELMRMGADNLTGALLNQAKMQARLNLIVAGTTDAQGDAANTAGSYANLLKRMQSTFVDLGTEMGQKFLPIAAAVVQRITGMADVIRPFAERASQIAANVLPMIGSVMLSVGETVYAAVEGIMTRLGGFTQLVQSTFVPNAVASFQVLSGILTGLWDMVTTVFGSIGSAIGSVLDMAGVKIESTGTAFETFYNYVRRIGLAIGVLFENWKTVIALAMTEVALAVVGMANEIHHHFTVRIPTVLGWLARTWIDTFGQVRDFTRTVFINIANNIADFFLNLPNLMTDTVDFADIWRPVTDGFEFTFAKLPEIAQRKVGETEAALMQSAAAMRGQLQSAYNDALAENAKLSNAVNDGIGRALAGDKAEVEVKNSGTVTVQQPPEEQQAAEEKAATEAAREQAQGVASSVRGLLEGRFVGGLTQMFAEFMGRLSSRTGAAAQAVAQAASPTPSQVRQQSGGIASAGGGDGGAVSALIARVDRIAATVDSLAASNHAIHATLAGQPGIEFRPIRVRRQA